VVVRHPMPYGNLSAQRVQRYASVDDLKSNNCTIEEMEEYEPHIVNGSVVYAGVDYGAILQQAQKEADVILWDGGNNDTPFFVPDVHIVVVDPLRPGHELRYFPGETNLRMAHVVVINKQDEADKGSIQTVRDNVGKVNPAAMIVDAASPITVTNPEIIRGKRVLVVEDGPTLTHGEMAFGAATVAARKFGAARIIDPRPFIQGSLAETFKKYPAIGHVLPAMGYGSQQIKDLESTIRHADCDMVIIGTPIDLGRIINIDKPHVRVFYELLEIGKPDLNDALRDIC
jgi:predicted GTPase